MAEGAVLTVDRRAITAVRPTSRSKTAAEPGDWLLALRRYVMASALLNLIWEFAQLPLYTLWHEGSVREIVFAAVHCTGGDILIASVSLIAMLMIVGSGRWPHDRFRIVAGATIISGLAYTIFSEWLNTEIRGNWAYSDWMPTLPLIGAGLSPLTQWIIVPIAAFWWARRPFVAVVDQGREIQ